MSDPAHGSPATDRYEQVYRLMGALGDRQDRLDESLDRVLGLIERLGGMEAMIEASKKANVAQVLLDSGKAVQTARAGKFYGLGGLTVGVASIIASVAIHFA